MSQCRKVLLGLTPVTMAIVRSVTMAKKNQRKSQWRKKKSWGKGGVCELIRMGCVMHINIENGNCVGLSSWKHKRLFSYLLALRYFCYLLSITTTFSNSLFLKKSRLCFQLVSTQTNKYMKTYRSRYINEQILLSNMDM